MSWMNKGALILSTIFSEVAINKVGIMLSITGSEWWWTNLEAKFGMAAVNVVLIFILLVWYPCYKINFVLETGSCFCSECLWCFISFIDSKVNYWAHVTWTTTATHKWIVAFVFWIKLRNRSIRSTEMDGVNFCVHTEFDLLGFWLII
jgi:hypothetical protein